MKNMWIVFDLLSDVKDTIQMESTVMVSMVMLHLVNNAVLEISEHNPGALFGTPLCYNIDFLNSALGVVFRNLQYVLLAHYDCTQYKRRSEYSLTFLINDWWEYMAECTRQQPQDQKVWGSIYNVVHMYI